MSPSLVFVVPVQVDDGTKVDFIDENGNVHWGAVEAGGPKEDSPTDPHRVTLAALPTRQISEKSAELDLNHDGDTSDYFQLGSLRARTSGGVETILNSDRLVLSQIGAGAFDADGDQVADPLFKIEGETFIDSNLNGIHDESEAFVDANLNETWDGILTISLLAFNTDRAGRGHSFLYRTRIHLQNN
jgi:hypothetical protein